VSGSDFLREASAELYGSDPEEFTERRTALASRARAAGDRAAAKEIAGLRKPTRSAWMINQLVRADPGVADRLAGLGDELRAAAAALDGAKIRELSQERRKLVDTLIRRTLQQAGEQSPSAAVREDLTATFGAALADPQVARDLADGILVRAAHHADFGTGAPELTLVPPPLDATGVTPSPGREAAGIHGDVGADELKEAGRGREAAGSRAAGVSRAEASRGPRATRAGGSRGEASRTARPAGTGGKAAADEVRAARAAERAKAAEEARAAEEGARAARAARAAEDRQRAIAEAEQTLEDASREADRAAKDEQDARDTIQALESQLDEAHRRVTEARRKARDKQSALQKARRTLARLTPARRDRG
jgi:hypothetical protein